jgi:hypothetical protein
MHPLAPNLSELTIEELTGKYNELVKKTLQAQRLGSGALVNQLGMLMEDYRLEISRRQQQILADANKNASFKNIIEIS